MKRVLIILTMLSCLFVFAGAALANQFDCENCNGDGMPYPAPDYYIIPDEYVPDCQNPEENLVCNSSGCFDAQYGTYAHRDWGKDEPTTEHRRMAIDTCSCDNATFNFVNGSTWLIQLDIVVDKGDGQGWQEGDNEIYFCGDLRTSDLEIDAWARGDMCAETVPEHTDYFKGNFVYMSGKGSSAVVTNNVPYDCSDNCALGSGNPGSTNGAPTTIASAPNALGLTITDDFFYNTPQNTRLARCDWEIVDWPEICISQRAKRGWKVGFQIKLFEKGSVQGWCDVDAAECSCIYEIGVLCDRQEYYCLYMPYGAGGTGQFTSLAITPLPYSKVSTGDQALTFTITDKDGVVREGVFNRFEDDVPPVHTALFANGPFFVASVPQMTSYFDAEGEDWSALDTTAFSLMVESNYLMDAWGFIFAGTNGFGVPFKECCSMCCECPDFGDSLDKEFPKPPYAD